jgi:hypothetical protein
MEELGASNATITSGCLIGMVQRHLLDRQDPKLARAYYERMRGLVKPGNFYVEVFPHICSHNWVQGVFLTLQEEVASPSRSASTPGKTLRPTRARPRPRSWRKAFKRTGNKHTHLLAVKDYRTWTDRTPAHIVCRRARRGLHPERVQAVGARRRRPARRQPVHARPRARVRRPDPHQRRQPLRARPTRRSFRTCAWRSPARGASTAATTASRAEAIAALPRDRLGPSEKEFESWVENSYEWADKLQGLQVQDPQADPDELLPGGHARLTRWT